LCMSCRRVVCQECATTWDGVNHCRPCLARLRTSSERRTPLLSWAFFLVLAVLLLGLTGRAMAWAGALAARLF